MDAETCYEIVHFTFRAEVPEDAQLAHLRALGSWVADQPGFLWRRCYRDDDRGCWTDLVAWANLGAARAAAGRAMAQPDLAPAMSAIEQSGMSFGHYRQIIATEHTQGTA